jgi:hypothetical protein
MSDDRFEEVPSCRFCGRLKAFGPPCCPEAAAVLKDAVIRQPGGLADVQVVTAEDIENWLTQESE